MEVQIHKLHSIKKRFFRLIYVPIMALVVGDELRLAKQEISLFLIFVFRLEPEIKHCHNIF